MTRPLILTIEDNEQNRYLLHFLLEQNGFQVAEARDGLEGLELARRLVPAAILLDIQLPAVSGYTVAAKLREIAELATVPIIAVTSFAMVGDRERCLQAGASDYVEKPIDAAVLLGKLREHLGAPARGAEHTAQSE
jgi:two-component system, cell cycle response regulator DivK